MFKVIISLLSLIFINKFFAQEDFILSTKNFEPYFPTYIGNGHFSLSSSLPGTLPEKSFTIKVYDHAKDDIPRIAALPYWNEINYFNGIKWLNDPEIDTTQFANYTQKLNMSNSSLETSYSWTVNNKKTDISIYNFISRSNNFLAVIKIEVTPDFSDTIRLSFPISEREKPKRLALAKLEKLEPDPPGNWPTAWYPGFTQVVTIKASTDSNIGRISALSETEGRKTQVAINAEIFSRDKIKDVRVSSLLNKNSASINFSFPAEKGKTYTFYKFISIISEKEVPGDIIHAASENSRMAKQTGFNKLLQDHNDEWNKLWQTDIVVEGDKEFQKIIHSMMYYLICSIDENTDFSIPPMGLATDGYYGHIFWDADTYMFPPLLLMHPDIAKSIVMFRYSTLDVAKRNAAKNNYKGAMYPWESDEIGEETTPYFAYQNALKENHIVGDVAFAQWQYYLATKDLSWLRVYGAKIIEGCANFWVSRVNYNKEKSRYEIGKLVSVSEGHTDVSNETYTNSIAKLNLEIANKVNELLGNKRNGKWEEVSKNIFIPYNKEKEYHPIFENAGETGGASELWSSVVPLLSYPLQIEMSENAKRNNLKHSIINLEQTGAGAMMGIVFLPIIAAELNDDSLFHYTMDRTLKGFFRPPFNALAETHTNQSINFITGAGAFLQQVIFGYTGLRITEDGIIQKFKPMLPKNITSLTLKNFTINNKQQDILVKNGEIKFIKR